MGKGFRLILAVVAISICTGEVIGGDQPASAGEMTPETEKLFRAIRSNDFPAVKRNLLDGGDVRAENAAGLTVIDLAIDKGYFKIAHYLLAWRKQRKPKPKLPLPLPAPPPITAEVAPTAEPAAPEPARGEAPKAQPSPPEQAREAAPIAPQPPQPLAAAESTAKPALIPIETATKPEPWPKTAAVTPPAEKTAENPPSAPTSEPPQPEAAATEPTDNKILTPPPAESPGILDQITGFFTSEAEPKAPDPKPLTEENRPEPEKAAEDRPGTPVEQATASAIAAPEEEKAPEVPGVFDQIARFFASETEPKDHSASQSEAKPEPRGPAVKPDEAPETAPQAAQPLPQPRPCLPLEAVLGLCTAAKLDKPESESPSVPMPEIAPEPEKAAEEQGAFDNIVRFFTSEPETSKPEGLSGAVGKKPKNEIQGVSNASTPPFEPEPAAKAVVEEIPKPLPENTPPAEPVREAAENLTPHPPEKPEDRSDIITRIQDMLSIGPEKEAPPTSKPEKTAAIPASAPAPRPIPEPTPSPSPVVQPSAAPKSTTIEPFIGTSMKLGKRWQKDTEHTCVSKRSRRSLFCIEPVDWPQEIAPSFQVHTTLYRGRKSIVRYDEEVATQFHTLFPTGNFDAIVEHFSKLLGPPTEKPVIWVVMIGKPNRKNRTARWIGPQKAGGKNGDQGGAPGILDVREVDDLRWSLPPDDRHGVVWLYRQGGLPVFRHVSWSDFLLARAPPATVTRP